jgi:hypothetical protein
MAKKKYFQFEPGLRAYKSKRLAFKFRDFRRKKGMLANVYQSLGNTWNVTY